jgi:DNA primase
VFHCFGGGCGAEGNVLDFVHRMEVRDGAPVTIRQAALALAKICGIAIEATGSRKGARKPKDGPRPHEAQEGPSTPANASQRAPNGQETASGKASEPTANKPLGFALKLDPMHPYLSERGIPPELVERFGLGFCEKGIMAGRVCIPIQNVDGQTVAYAGRWVGPLEDIPEGKGRYELPAGFHKELELFNLHRAKHCRHLVVVEGYFGAIRLHGLRIPTVALMGCSVSVKQLEHLAHANARHITVMLDGDEAGRAASEEVAGVIANVAWSRIVHLPDDVQPDTVDVATLERLLGRGER